MLHWMWGAWGTTALMLVFGSMVLVPIILTLRWLVTTGVRGEKADEPLEILKRRYTRGELSREEYEVQRQDLRA